MKELKEGQRVRLRCFNNQQDEGVLAAIEHVTPEYEKPYTGYIVQLDEKFIVGDDNGVRELYDENQLEAI